METIAVGLGSRSYDIVIEDGLIEHVREHLFQFARGKRLLVVSDETVWSTLSERLKAGLGDIEAVPLLVAPGEDSKSWSGLQSLCDRLLAEGIERKDVIVAFGGGVVGDLAGFAAAIVNRGCAFVQIPTTLLAQVDSSVGGKTGINVAAGKNLVGAFHQPKLVLIDPNVLDSLDSRQIRAGYAEIAKYGLIEDAQLFAWLESEGAKVVAGDTEARRRAIAAAVRGKAKVTEADEHEMSGRRALLNLGHTFGHALEAATGFSGRLYHGEAVALGCVLAFDFSVARGLCPEADAARVRAHFESLNLPTTLQTVGLGGRGAKLACYMTSDKKRELGRTAFILARGIGQAFVDKSVDLAQIAAFLDGAR